MTELVPSDQIEEFVGTHRHPRLHLGAGRSEDGLFYIMHSQACLNKTEDLRSCEFSQSLDQYGVEFWEVDTPLVLHIDDMSGEIFTESYEDYDE